MNLKAKRDAKIARQTEIINRAKAEKRELTTEEQAELDGIQREIDELTIRIKAEEPEAGDNNRTEDAVRAERTRSAEITALCRDFNINPDSYITGGQSLEEVRAAVLEQLKKTRGPVDTRPEADVSVISDAEDKFRAAAVDALLLRGNVAIEKPAAGANELRGMSLRDLAIESLEKEGKTGLNRRSSDDIFNELHRGYYNPTSAFNSILDSTIKKAYVEGHKSVNVTFDRFVKKGSLSDFKTHDNNYLAGPAGEFYEIPEGGEIKHERITDVKRPTRKLKTFGRQFTMTRQAFINDDIDFVTSLPARYAAAARKTQNKQVYRIMCNNPAIYDGTALFSSAHRNMLASGTGITRESLQKMIMALQTQNDEFGEAIIVNPSALIVPSGYAFDIYTILSSTTINTSDNTQAANPLYKYRDMIEVIEDPTINVLSGGFGKTMPWFLVGSKSDTDFIQIDYLNGQEIPNIRRTEAAGQLGFVWDIYLDWSIAVMDYRGCVKNPGIVVKDPLV